MKARLATPATSSGSERRISVAVSGASPRKSVSARMSMVRSCRSLARSTAAPSCQLSRSRAARSETVTAYDATRVWANAGWVSRRWRRCRAPLDAASPLPSNLAECLNSGPPFSKCRCFPTSSSRTSPGAFTMYAALVPIRKATISP